MKKLKQQLVRRVISSALVALVLMLGLASVYPDLHEALHMDSECGAQCQGHTEQDSEETEHSCAVTLLQTGVLIYIDGPQLKAATTLVEFINHSEGIYVLQSSFCLPLGRAPPIAGIV